MAGGSLQFNGILENTPTWVHLNDTIAPSEEVLPEFNKPLHCPTNGLLVKENFREIRDQGGFRPNLGTFVEVHGTFWEVQQRRSRYSGVHIDLKSIRDCIDVSTAYEFSLDIRMVKDGYEGKQTTCGALGTDCVEVFLDYLKDSLDAQYSVVKYNGPGKGTQFNYGEWSKIQGTITFNDQELDPSNVFLSLRIAGKFDMMMIDVVLPLSTHTHTHTHTHTNTN